MTAIVTIPSQQHLLYSVAGEQLLLTGPSEMVPYRFVPVYKNLLVRLLVVEREETEVDREGTIDW